MLELRERAESDPLGQVVSLIVSDMVGKEVIEPTRGPNSLAQKFEFAYRAQKFGFPM